MNILQFQRIAMKVKWIRLNEWEHPSSRLVLIHTLWSFKLILMLKLMIEEMLNVNNFKKYFVYGMSHLQHTYIQQKTRISTLKSNWYHDFELFLIRLFIRCGFESWYLRLKSLKLILNAEFVMRFVDSSVVIESKTFWLMFTLYIHKNGSEIERGNRFKSAQLAINVIT